MTDVQLILNEIDRRVEDLGVSGSVWDGRNELLELKEFVKSLQIKYSSLDILLEEGAERFNTEDAARMWDYEGKTEGDIVKAAYIEGGKAGANWVESRGVNVGGRIMKASDGQVYVESDYVPLEGKCGDRIMIQIRKI